MLKFIYELEGYIVHETDERETALGLLQAAEGSMIFYLEPLLVGRPGNDLAREFVKSRDERPPQVWILLASMYNIEQAMDHLRADGFLEQPVTVDQAIATVEAAQQLLKARRTPPTAIRVIHACRRYDVTQSGGNIRTEYHYPPHHEGRGQGSATG